MDTNDEASEIISELASMEPCEYRSDNDAHCLFCEARAAFKQDIKHKDRCIWIRAKVEDGERRAQQVITSYWEGRSLFRKATGRTTDFEEQGNNRRK